MEKVGLCVRYDCDNYGSMLQIKATQNVLTQLGLKYEIIRYDKRTFAFYLTNITRIFNPYFMKGIIESYKKNKELKSYPDFYEADKKRRECISKYRKNNIGPYSEVYKGYRNLVKASEKYECVFVGSDQLWTPAGIKSKFYNLLFVPDNIKKVSFATSFGVAKIPKNQLKLTRKYLNRINELSVREQRGAEIVKELTGRNATVALDPTLLFNGEQWCDIFSEKKIITDSYIFAFFLGDNSEHRDCVEELSKKTGLKIVTIPFMDAFSQRDLKFGDEKLFEVDPVDFLNLIRGAEFICTDSFHGSVFSILNHKKFITFDRTNNNDKQTRNSRIDSLFSLLNLKQRRFQTGDDIYSKITSNIDYEEVDIKLNELRKETFDFLNNAIN